MDDLAAANGRTLRCHRAGPGEPRGGPFREISMTPEYQALQKNMLAKREAEEERPAAARELQTDAKR